MIRSRFRKIQIFFVGILFSCLIGVLMAIFFSDFYKRLDLVLRYGVSLLPSAIWVGWSLKRPTWKDGILFGGSILLFCLIISFLCKLFSPTYPIELFPFFVFALYSLCYTSGGVLLGGYFYAKRHRQEVSGGKHE
jgi:hypothetical protein